jgi:hypothetical protein
MAVFPQSGAGAEFSDRAVSRLDRSAARPSGTGGDAVMDHLTILAIGLMSGVPPLLAQVLLSVPVLSPAPPPQVRNSVDENPAFGSKKDQPNLVNPETEPIEAADIETASVYSPSYPKRDWRGVMRRCIDFLDSKAFNAPLVGAVALVTFGQMDYDWHAIALSLFTVGGYWLIFRDRS